MVTGTTMYCQAQSLPQQPQQTQQPSQQQHQQATQQQQQQSSHGYANYGSGYYGYHASTTPGLASDQQRHLHHQHQHQFYGTYRNHQHHAQQQQQQQQPTAGSNPDCLPACLSPTVAAPAGGKSSTAWATPAASHGALYPPLPVTGFQGPAVARSSMPPPQHGGSPDGDQWPAGYYNSSPDDRDLMGGDSHSPNSATDYSLYLHPGGSHPPPRGGQDYAGGSLACVQLLQSGGVYARRGPTGGHQGTVEQQRSAGGGARGTQHHHDGGSHGVGGHVGGFGGGGGHAGGGHTMAPFDWMKKQTYPIIPISGKTRTKDKYRIVYTELQKVELEKEFLYNHYITIQRKAELAVAIGLSDRQVKIWFQNRRAKDRKHKKRGGGGNSGGGDSAGNQPQRSHKLLPPPPKEEIHHHAAHGQLRGGGMQQDAGARGTTGIKMETDPMSGMMLHRPSAPPPNFIQGGFGDA